jgi:Ca-activated chloride channel homolog
MTRQDASRKDHRLVRGRWARAVAAFTGLFLLLAGCGGTSGFLPDAPGAPPPSLVVPPNLRELRGFAPGLGAGAPVGRLQGVVPRALVSYYDAGNAERYPSAAANAIQRTLEEPVSTFSVDVDRASYANVRRYLSEGSLPPPDAVRVEEMINYFDYAYALPEDKRAPFSPTVAVYPSPWNAGKQILHIGIKGFDIPREARPKANLVFLVDTSGSMAASNRLPLFKRAFRMLTDRLRDNDRVAIVTYAGRAGVALEPTLGSQKQRILDAVEDLAADGMTAGSEGLRTAYRLARANFDKDAANRVLIATDGDFNAGISEPDALEALITRERASGVYLTVLGFGDGNYNDALMQKLAQAGNGIAAYIDTEMEARKVFADELAGTLFTIAKDVKVQVEFDPARLAEYRLIGYETRALSRTDFDNDKVDAGDIGSGHTVTALYEISPVSPSPAPFASIKLRYKLPGEEESRLIERRVTDSDAVPEFSRLPADIRFAAAVAGAGQLLRHDPNVKDFDYGNVIEMAEAARGDDEYGYRDEFIRLMFVAKTATTLNPIDLTAPIAPR